MSRKQKSPRRGPTMVGHASLRAQARAAAACGGGRSSLHPPPPPYSCKAGVQKLILRGSLSLASQPATCVRTDPGPGVTRHRPSVAVAASSWCFYESNRVPSVGQHCDDRNYACRGPSYR
eukprot:68794-Prymnesium_polylepis.1